jgi:SAM-dependent methyltransferase
MNHADHVRLLRGGVLMGAEDAPGGIWADLGSGTGAFTLALADLIGPRGVIYSVDRDQRALAEQEKIMRARAENTAPTVHYHVADFTRPLDLPPLDGIVMANSLHFHRNKEPVVRSLKGDLRPGGRLILVEYNIDAGSPWVPYPLSYPTWEALARRCGLINTRLLATIPSRFLREIYSAVSWS